jgi:hypothetical protein
MLLMELTTSGVFFLFQVLLLHAMMKSQLDMGLPPPQPEWRGLVAPGNNRPSGCSCPRLRKNTPSVFVRPAPVIGG